MQFFTRFPRCGIGLLFVLLFPFASQSQVLEGNYIIITLQGQTYDCSTGQAFVKFHITNYDQYGSVSYSHTVYSIDLGASRVVGRSLPGGDGDVWFTGAYHPGDDIVCTAQGISDNDAPETEFRFVGSSGSVPAKPVISSSAGMPLCNGASTTLSVNDASGSYVWSNGASGVLINVNVAGSYTVHAVGGCGNSAESDPVVITVAAVPAAPVIGSSNGVLLCNGQATNFSSTSSGGTINWSNGASGTSMNTSAAGTYYASETNGCGTSGNSNVIVISTGNTPGAPSVSSSNGTSLCNGESTTLTATPTAGGLITWSTGQTGNSITVSAPGSYYAYESNSCGTGGNSNTMVITTGSVPSAPTISSNNGVLLCNGASTVLSAAGGENISWNTGANGSSISVSSAGSYYARASNNCGTSSPSNTIVITTANTPSAPTIASSNGTLLCFGASTVLSTAPSAGGTIRWNTGASGNTTTVSDAGNYYAYESNGCGNGSNSNTITISSLFMPPTPTVTPSGNQLLCNGASVTLTSSGDNPVWSNGATGNTITVSEAGSYYTYDQNACGHGYNSNIVNVTTVVCPTPIPGGAYFVCPGALKILDAGAGYDSYLWSNGAITRTISVGPGTYTVTVSRQGCYATSAAVTVGYYTVNTPTVSASGALVFCEGGSVVLSASAGTAYVWNTGANASSITVSSSGNYYVTVTDANGCQATSAAVGVNVHPLPVASISGNATVCQNGASPVVVFTGSGGAAPYTFSYHVNGGSVQTVSTTSGNSVSVSVPTSAAGSFSYALVSVQESSSTACTNEASGSVTVTVNGQPTATVSGSTTICKNSAAPSVVFTASGGSGPYTFSYRVNGGTVQFATTSSGNTIAVAVPTSSTGTFVYSLVSVQEQGGCVNSASGNATITVNHLPDASISGSAVVCKGSVSPTIVFSGSGGIAPYTFTYSINGGAAQTVSTVSGNTVSVTVPTSVAGDFVYSLLSVQESSGTACANTASGNVTVTVRALPTATISGTTAVCLNALSPSIVFTGNGGTAPYTFGYRINGGLLQTITTTSGNTASVLVPTASAGNFSYDLVSVQEASSTACIATVSGNATVTVNPLPTATIGGAATVCQNSSSPVITFTGASGSTPYTFVYRVNGGADQTVTSTGAVATIAVPTTTAGSFTYTLLSVQDASATACSNAANGSAVIVVNSQPVKAIVTTSNAHLCNGETGVLTISNYVSGNTYNWYKNGALVRSSVKDTLQVTVAGSYTVLPVSAQGCEAASVSNAVIITTGSVVTPVITGSLKVCEGGKSLLAIQSNSYDSWRWKWPPDKVLSEDSSFFAAAGQYRVWVSAQGCADSVNVAVTADDTEFPAGRLTITPSVLNYGESAALIADVRGADHYQWEVNSGRKIQTGGNVLQQNFFESGDSIPVKVWATSVRNCTSLFTAFVKVGPMIRDTLPDNSFTGTVRDWNVFPIPFTNQLKITAILKRNENVRMDLFTAEGRWLRDWQFKGLKGENLFALGGLENLLSGSFYFITGFYNGEKHYEKILKQ